MRKKLVMGLLLVVNLMFILAFISADFESGNLSYSIETSYAPEGNVRGWINLSLDNEFADSLFEDSQGNSITLIDLLKINKKIGYTGFEDYLCNPLDCMSDYSATNPEEAKTFVLGAKESKIVGFKFVGEITNINSVDFSVRSDASLDCSNQLKIDFLNDLVIDTGNYKTSESVCSFLKSYGCFNFSDETIEGDITSKPYCQRIKLEESPGFLLGAWVRNVSGYQKIEMALYDVNTGESIENANCELPQASSEGSEISCSIDYLVTEVKEHYVCISSDSTEGEYKVKASMVPEAKCGFFDYPLRAESAAYNIFVQSKKFDNVGELNITNTLSHGNELGVLVEDYIFNKYGDFDCTGGCIVPVKFLANQNQDVVLENLNIKYDTNILQNIEENNFYDLGEIPAKISAGFQRIYLDDANFSVSENYGEDIFVLKLGESEVLSEKINIEKVPIITILRPLATASAYPTVFEVTVDSSGSITKYEWDFGDNSSDITNTNEVTHTYGSVGQYKLKVIVTDSAQRSSYKVFDIKVDLPQERINETIEKMQKDLTNVKEQISNFSVGFYRDSLNSALNVSGLENELKQIQKDFKSASSEDDYNQIMGSLLNLEVLEQVSVSKSADSVLFYPDESNIDLDILKTIGGGDYGESSKREYLDAVFSWNQKNLETRITFKEISAVYAGVGKSVLNLFEIKINERDSLSYDSYIIIRKLDNLEFKEDYSENEESDYIYIDLAERGKTITFSTTENVDFIDLPLFISPKIDRLVIKEVSLEEEEKKSKWTIFILIMILLIIIGLGVYLVLQGWYKRKYENYLFKNRNSLYNLINYITNSRKKNIKDKGLISSLKKAGWKSEQISYVMRKYAGKRTGMWEIPIDKILDKFEEKKNLSKIQNNKNKKSV